MKTKQRFHINNDGKPGRYKAKPGNCKFQSKHFSSEQMAQDAVNKAEFHDFLTSKPSREEQLRQLLPDDSAPRMYSSNELEYKARAASMYAFIEENDLMDPIDNYAGISYDYINSLLRYGTYEEYVKQDNDSRDLFYSARIEGTKNEWNESKLQWAIESAAERNIPRIKKLDDALDALPTMKKPAVFYRAVKDYSDTKSADVGTIIEDKAYLSISEDPTTMMVYEDKGFSEMVVLEIVTDKAKFTAPGTADPYDFDNYFQNEKEHMLPRNTKLKVVGRKQVLFKAPDYRTDMVDQPERTYTVLQVIDVTE